MFEDVAKENERVRRLADARAVKIERTIVRKAAKLGVKGVYVRAHAHVTPGYHGKPTGAVALTIQTVKRQRTMNDLKKPFDLDAIARLLVEKDRFDENRRAEQERKDRLADRFGREVDKLCKRYGYPSMPLGLWVSSDDRGIDLQISHLTAKRAREVLEVLSRSFSSGSKDGDLST